MINHIGDDCWIFRKNDWKKNIFIFRLKRGCCLRKKLKNKYGKRLCLYLLKIGCLYYSDSLRDSHEGAKYGRLFRERCSRGETVSGNGCLFYKVIAS